MGVYVSANGRRWNVFRWQSPFQREQGRVTGSAPPSRLRALMRDYPRSVTLLMAFVGAMVAADAVVMSRWLAYRREVDRLRTGMTDAERQRATMTMRSEQNRLMVTLELVRRQSQRDHELHLSVAVDSGRMYLERDGVVLRTMPVTVGPDRVVGAAPNTVRLAKPRGARTVERVLAAGDAWEVPSWVFMDRGLADPGERRLKGALGRAGILLSGGTVIYSLPKEGPLSDSSYVMPGAILLRGEDLRAVAPNITPGVTVYFY